ncbi:hypothetical protein [Ornithinibacillus californiensis]|nr:hypothetical protein [Ornithinibacillus californiensis]
MDEQAYRIIKSISLVVGVGSLIYIGMQLTDIKESLESLARLAANGMFS